MSIPQRRPHSWLFVQTLIDQGVMSRLVVLLNTGDSALRLNALWAFKNLLYKATPELKRQVMNHLGWQEIRQ